MNLVLVELNEINFDVVSSYIGRGESLPGFQQLFTEGLTETTAEDDYLLLEPWIQWPSVHTGKRFSEHNIFRLGDMANSDLPQFFEQVERSGYTVGAISAMNAKNSLQAPKYFIPDPWTVTPSDQSFLSSSISRAVSQAVNDNSQEKLKISTLVSLVIAFVVLVRPSKMPSMIAYALTVLGKPWRKALFLDKFLHQVHMKLYKKCRPNFSTIFLNAGAHIQHHYFFNSAVVDNKKLSNPTWYIAQDLDPVLEMLKCYDEIILELLDLDDTELIIATGLSQKPYDRVKFYYRLLNHKKFLTEIGIKFVDVLPRMTRDFLILFDSPEDALVAEEKLSEIFVDDTDPLFGEIDNRGGELFVTLTYPHEISENTCISVNGHAIQIKDSVAFVAIKNGMHQSKGFAYFSNGIVKYSPKQNSHVSEIYSSVLKYFGLVVS